MLPVSTGQKLRDSAGARPMCSTGYVDIFVGTIIISRIGSKKISKFHRGFNFANRQTHAITDFQLACTLGAVTVGDDKCYP